MFEVIAYGDSNRVVTDSYERAAQIANELDDTYGEGAAAILHNGYRIA